MEVRFKFDGLVQFLNVYKGQLISKKRVALFDNYKAAKDQIVFEFCGNTDNFQPSDLYELLESIERIANIEEFFNEL